MSVYADEFAPYGDGRLAPLGSLKLKALHAELLEYRRQVAKRYRVLLPERLSQLNFDEKAWVSTKVDGQLFFLVKTQGEVAFVAYNGRVLQGIAVAREAEKLLADTDELLVAGELFAIPSEGRPRVHHITAALGDDARAKRVGFKAFDLVREGDRDYRLEDYGARLERLNALLGKGKRCGVVTTEHVDPKSLGQYFADWVTTGKFEGLVIRTARGITYKCKPKVYLNAVVLAYGERKTQGAPEVRQLDLGLLRPDGTYQLIGSVGNGMSQEDRYAWHARLAPLEVASSFRLANREGTLCRFVKPEVVVRIKCSDLMEQDGNDRALRRMTLRYADDRFAPVAPMPIAVPLHPVLDQAVDDAVVDAETVGLQQAYDHVPFDGLDQTPTAAAMPGAEVLEREAYVKVTKGRSAVRKYVVIATHKHEEDPDYAPYVGFFTDYSAGRKDPLKTSLVVGRTREQILDHVEAWKAKNIKRGWNLAQ